MRTFIVFSAFTLGASSGACSLLIDKSTTQCASNSDCHSSTYSLCRDSVCVDPRAVGAAGCASDASSDLLNACTDSSCVHFDNASRLTNSSADGRLKPLP